MSAFMPPAPPAPTPPALTVPVAAYVGGGVPEGAAAARGSYGPVIAMLAVVVVLAVAALAVGRLCFGRGRAPGQAGGHDLEAWVERACGPCVGAAVLTTAKEDGSIEVAAAAATDAEPPPEGTEREEGISIASAL